MKWLLQKFKEWVENKISEVSNKISKVSSRISEVNESISSKIDNKMDKDSPVGTGSFSLNRTENSEIGDYSFAEGYDTTASGDASHAEGNRTTASSWGSHAEGRNTMASGLFSHTEGENTTASSIHQHVQGKYNIEDSSSTYADIVGNGYNGYNGEARSNAYTLDWSGNGWFAGDVYVGSTSGTNKDEGSVRLARITDVPTAGDVTALIESYISTNFINVSTEGQ